MSAGVSATSDQPKYVIPVLVTGITMVGLQPSANPMGQNLPDICPVSHENGIASPPPPKNGVVRGVA
jgi:hypothetical protein